MNNIGQYIAVIAGTDVYGKSLRYNLMSGLVQLFLLFR